MRIHANCAASRLTVFILELLSTNFARTGRESDATAAAIMMIEFLCCRDGSLARGLLPLDSEVARRRRVIKLSPRRILVP
jgi:hypothetical protein